MTEMLPNNPWPCPGLRPFKPPSAHEPAVRASSKSAELFGVLNERRWNWTYRQGYFCAGNLIAEQFRDSHAPFALHPAILLPMLYLYRHYIEISLKALMFKWCALTDTAVPGELEKEHGLLPLWNNLKTALVQADGPDPDRDNTHAHVDRWLNDFHQVDAKSLIFRYATDVKGRPHQQRLPVDLDLSQLITVMASLHRYFEACDEGADQYLEIEDDLRSDGR